MILWRQEQERRERRRQWHLLAIIGVSIIVLAVALALLWPMPAGGQGRAKLTISAYPLGSEQYRLMELPKERKVLGVGEGAGSPILYVQHPVGSATEEVSVWLLYAGATWDDLGGDLFYIGIVQVQGMARFCYIRQMEQWPSATSGPGAPRPPARGDEPPFLERP